MKIRHGNTAEHGADDPQEALIRAANKQIFYTGASVSDFLGRAVNRALEMTGKAGNSFGCENIMVKQLGLKLRKHFCNK